MGENSGDSGGGGAGGGPRPRRADVGPGRLHPGQILHLLQDLQREMGLDYLLISHHPEVLASFMAQEVGPPPGKATEAS